MNLSPFPDAGKGGYAVLIRLSAGYPPEVGRLPTRYAPVRHYGHCYPPFDLHVLGLPLAFILSQDQTLHCKICSSLLRAGAAVSAKADATARVYLRPPSSFLRQVTRLIRYDQ